MKVACTVLEGEAGETPQTYLDNKERTNMTTMTLNIHNNNILESLKQVLSNMVGVEIESVNSTADDMDETEYISSSATMMRIIEKGDAEIAEGKGTKIAVEDLWK